MPAIKIFVTHAGETRQFPDEFSKPCYELIDGRSFPLNDQLNEAAVIKSVVDNPPDVGYIGFAHYRRHLVLPETLEQEKIYAHMERCFGASNADDFARFHSAKILRTFMDRIEDPFAKCWLRAYMEQTQAWQRSMFVMSKSRFENSFSAWFNSCWRAASSLCDECRRFGKYNRRMPGMLLERAIGAYVWQSGQAVPCGLTTYDIASPWQRGADELEVFLEGKWTK